MKSVNQLTHMLNEDGGIETDLTVVCINKNHFRIVSSAATKKEINIISLNIYRMK